jgi:prepilin-type N-terminal cleavage/methylation domain-containing protein
MKSAKGSFGFSLVEMIVAILIVGILAAVAVPYMNPMVGLVKLRTAANSIKRQMIVARTRALSDPNTHVGVYINTSTNTSLIFLDTNTATPYQYYSGDPVYMGTYQLPTAIWDSIPPTSAGGITNNVVVFRGDGSAKNGGSIIVKNKYGATRTVSVLASTGRAKVQ